jgi:hypothetical protein
MDSFHDDDPQPNPLCGTCLAHARLRRRKSAVLQDCFNGHKPAARKVETLTVSSGLHVGTQLTTNSRSANMVGFVRDS